jgi:hypothetical protein
MNESKAREVAAILGGVAWQTGNNLWTVRLERFDGNIVLITDEDFVLFEDEAALADDIESVWAAHPACEKA